MTTNIHHCHRVSFIENFLDTTMAPLSDLWLHERHNNKDTHPKNCPKQDLRLDSRQCPSVTKVNHCIPVLLGYVTSMMATLLILNQLLTFCHCSGLFSDCFWHLNGILLCLGTILTFLQLCLHHTRRLLPQ